MSTIEMIERMKKLGWVMPRHIVLEPERDVLWYRDKFDGSTLLSDQHACDLLFADFGRWLIGNGRKYIESSMYSDGFHVAWVESHRAESNDKLAALVSVAEQVMKVGP